MGALLFAALLPGWCLWRLIDPAWHRHRLDLRLALAGLISCAATPLVLFWLCYGHRLATVGCAGALLALCLCLLGWEALLPAGGRGDESAGPVPPEGEPRVIRAPLAALVVVFGALIMAPWLTNGRVVGEMISQSPCSGDWSKHRALTAAILDTGIPPRNPFLCQAPLTYYYGHYLTAAAVVTLSGGTLSVDGALRALSLLLAAATCVLLFHFARDLTGSSAAALTATAVTVLVAGLDLPVLAALRHWVGPWWWNLGHLGVWTEAPRIPPPFANLHWATQHHSAALLGLCLAWHLSRPLVRPDWRMVLGCSVLVGGVLVTSAYLGGVVLVALLLLILSTVWARFRPANLPALSPLPLAVGAALGIALAGGIVLQAGHMVHNERRAIRFSLPEVPWGADWVWLGVNGAGASTGRGLRERLGELHRQAGSGAATAGELRWSWLAARTPRRIVNHVLGLLAVPVQLGLVGLLALGGCRGRRAPPLPRPIIVFTLCALGLGLFARNFDLQLRSMGLLWLLLGFWAARNLAGAPFARRRGLRLAGCACLAAVGLAGLGFDVAGMARPVYFDRHDIRVMQWVRTHTPPQAVVQAFPDTYPRIAWMPRVRYFARPCYPEFTGRCAVMGDRAHVRMFALPSQWAPLRAHLQAAFSAPDAAGARARLAREGVEYVLWTSREEQSGEAGAKRNLLDPACFRLLFRDGASFVVAVR